MLTFFGLNNGSKEALQKTCLFIQQKRLNEIIWLMINANFGFEEAENLSLDERTYIIGKLKKEFDDRQNKINNASNNNETDELIGIKKGLRSLKFK